MFAARHESRYPGEASGYAPAGGIALATATEARPVDYRALMKKVEHLVASLGRAEDEGSTIQSLIESIVVNFRDELGIYGGRLYRRRGAFYVLSGIFGDAKEGPRGLKVPVPYPPIEPLIEDRPAYMDAADPRTRTT